MSPQTCTKIILNVYFTCKIVLRLKKYVGNNAFIHLKTLLFENVIAPLLVMTFAKHGIKSAINKYSAMGKPFYIFYVIHMKAVKGKK